MTPELLVAIDGSKHSERIVKYASSLAKRLQSKVALVFVVPKSTIPDEYKEFARIENIGELEYFDEIGKAILKKYSSILKEEGTEHETLTELGNTAERIILLAQKRNSEMIIVGLQGLHGLAKVRSLGSVARRIIENSPMPIIIVP